MKKGIIISIALSIGLVASATIIRLGNNGENTIGLQVEGDTIAGDGLTMDQFFANAAPASLATTNSNELTETDKLSRQLFSDYMTLSENDETTPDNLKYLAERYASEISRGKIYAEKATIGKLNITSDSAANVQAYSAALTGMRAKYGMRVESSSKGVDFSNVESDGFANFMKGIGEIYETYASEMIKMKVPTYLAQAHLDLINNYLETAVTAKVIGNIKTDPLAAYLALNTYARNAENETALLMKIQVAAITSLGSNSQGI